MTNIRYAGDLLIFGKSESEKVQVFEILVAELEGAGLSVNARKTQILTTDNIAVFSESPVLINAARSMLEVFRAGYVHRYLGKVLSARACRH